MKKYTEINAETERFPLRTESAMTRLREPKAPAMPAVRR